MSEEEEQQEGQQAQGPGPGALFKRAGEGPKGFAAKRDKEQIAAALFGRSLAPTKLARYAIIRELGAGGMGTVYLGYDDQLDRRVAIKLLRGAKAGAEARARLTREAQAMARLSHPNVVTVYEVGDASGELFVAMEYVQGHDLRGWLEGEARGRGEILAVFLGAGEGLRAAHGAGIVHRDFKPDNVLIGTQGRARVADFGLAYGLGGSGEARAEAAAERALGGLGETLDAVGSSASASSSPSRSSGALEVPLTRTGALLGTPAYMSPEQFAGRVSDERSDQFSFCVALWEALFGARPFVGESLHELAVAVSAGEIQSSTQARPGREEEGPVPPWLVQVLSRGLSVDPRARWPDMASLLAALADDPERRRRRRWRVALGASAAGLAFTGLGWFASAELRESLRQRYWSAFTEDLLVMERERGLRQANGDAEQARDATRMSVHRRYRRERGAKGHEDPTLAAILLREVGPLGRASEGWISAANMSLSDELSHAVLRGHSGRIKALVFGEGWLYSAASDGEVWAWEVATGAGRVLLRHDAAINVLALSPEGDALLAGANDGQVWQLALGGAAWGPPREVLALEEHAGAVTWVGFDPTGRRLATASKDGRAFVYERAGAALARPRRRWVLDDSRGESAVLSAAFDDDGERLAVGESQGGVALWSTGGGALLERLPAHQGSVYHLRFAGQTLISAADDGAVRASGRALPLIEHGTAVSALDVWGEGGEVRVASGDVGGEVFLADLDGEPARALGDQGGGVWALRFTPDGGQLAVTSLDGKVRLWPARGPGNPRVLVGHPDGVLRASMDGGGRFLATGSYADVRIWDLRRRVARRELEGHRGAILSVDRRPQPAGDGRDEQIVTASADGRARLWRVSDGAPLETLSLDAGEGAGAVPGGPLNVARYSPDGARVALASSTGKIGLWEPGAGLRGEIHPSHEGDAGVLDLDFSPDGRHLATVVYGVGLQLWRVDGPAGPGLEPRLSVSAKIGGHGQVVHAGGGSELWLSAEGELQRWSVAEGARVGGWEAHPGGILDLALGPDGGVATAGEDHRAVYWPGTDPSAAVVFTGHTMPVRSVAFDGAGERLITASADGTARVWSIDGTLWATLRGHEEGLWRAVFIDDGRALTIAADRTARLWFLEGDGREPRSIELSGYGAGVIALEHGGSGGGWAALATGEGQLSLWSLGALTPEPEGLLERLWSVTTACLGAERRVLELGEELPRAQLGAARCADRGRE